MGKLEDRIAKNWRTAEKRQNRLIEAEMLKKEKIASARERQFVMDALKSLKEDIKNQRAVEREKCKQYEGKEHKELETLKSQIILEKEALKLFEQEMNRTSRDAKRAEA